MSLFGAQQVAGLLDPAKAAKAFDAVTAAVCEELDAPLQTLFGAVRGRKSRPSNTFEAEVHLFNRQTSQGGEQCRWRVTLSGHVMPT